MKALLLLAVPLLGTGCTFVQSAQPGSPQVVGDAWYAKDTHILGLPVGGDFYYCPKETPRVCTRAEMLDSAPSAAPAGQ